MTKNIRLKQNSFLFWQNICHSWQERREKVLISVAFKTYKMNLIHRNGESIFSNVRYRFRMNKDTFYTIFCNIFFTLKNQNPAICLCYFNTEGRPIYGTFLHATI